MFEVLKTKGSEEVWREFKVCLEFMNTFNTREQSVVFYGSKEYLNKKTKNKMSSKELDTCAKPLV